MAIIKNSVEIYKENDGWRVEVYNTQGEPQTVDDEIISNNFNLSDEELITLAKVRVAEVGLTADEYAVVE